ncbi:MAG: bifunctional diaminohydroxyphosphoribosylaminopyrimidine deaminase/5-amino-6-(5-phosphoribosylamino)uracil reductase RibD [Alphaproteobacteria bacterium]|nr:bifunctional diaminohydroxyphosphoribosylaminopyrimidine deaminase/5-amino-6-(5-phosphoribosylamino)uracil reductase RibD [Alphaproteobacteria bacterium]
MKLNDIHHMRSALNLARRGWGRVWPNPSVGCVVVDSAGHVVGRARTADGGRPHSETQALKMAGEYAKGATAYVTLEPCAHVGETPSCAEELVKAGVARVVIAALDPDPRTSGGGVEILKKAGIEVVTGVLEEEARALNAGFMNRFQSDSRPFVTLKTATTLDGKIATSTGQSKWITGELARKRGHLLRSQHDAIAVGVNTILEDNPALTTRIEGVNHAPVRIVFDTNLRLAGLEQVFKNISQAPVCIITSCNLDSPKAEAFIKRGAKLITVPKGGYGHVDLEVALAEISKLGITRLMVEGGAALLTSFIRIGAFDELYWFKAPSLIGADGLSNVGVLNIQKLDQKISLTPLKTIKLGEDMLDIYAARA